MHSPLGHFYAHDRLWPLRNLDRLAGGTVSKRAACTFIITVPLDHQSPLSRILTETYAGSTTW